MQSNNFITFYKYQNSVLAYPLHTYPQPSHQILIITIFPFNIQQRKDMMQASSAQIEQQQKARKVQEKIKLMMKYKKMQKLTSQKDLLSQKPLSTINDKTSMKFDEISVKNNRNLKNFLEQNKGSKQGQRYETYSSKRIKSIDDQGDMAPFPSTHNLKDKDESKKFILSYKQRKDLHQTQTVKKVPSVEKIQSAQDLDNRQSVKKIKRPSSVINKSTRATTSRSRKTKPMQPQDQKAMEEKIRQIIPSCFQFGIKLQKYADEKGVDLEKQQHILFSQELNIVKLISNCKKYYDLKTENEEEKDTKLSNGIQKQIIQMLRKKRQKQTLINKCESITDQISRLIDARLSALNKTKVTSL